MSQPFPFALGGFGQFVFGLLLLVAAEASLAQEPAAPPPEPPRLIDLNEETARQVLVDRQPGQYLGHPTTLLLEDVARAP